jgi:hypothetical protein
MHKCGLTDEFRAMILLDRRDRLGWRPGSDAALFRLTKSDLAPTGA